jgi:hypothetical protein
VVLPCAGAGSRLGLPFPKELAPAGPGRCVIDSSLDMIRACGSDVRVILMTDGRRDQTAAYVRDRLPGVPVAEVLQDLTAPDMTEAVLALWPWLGYVNVLLLPDVVYGWAGDPVTELAVKAVSYGFAAAAVKAGPGQIRTAGALRVLDDRIAAYEDKPCDPDGYNALWGMLAFSNGSFGLDGLRLVAESAARTRMGPVTDPPLMHAPVTWLSGFRDCGTWSGYLAEVRGDGDYGEASCP